jgi:nicotinamide riboside transporter PnuC
MSIYKCLRFLEALIMASLGLLCVFFLKAHIAGFFCFIASALYLSLALERAENE